MLKLSIHNVSSLASVVASSIEKQYPCSVSKVPLAYAIPRGGVPALYAVLAAGGRFGVAETPEKADFFIDDIIDSGSTMQHWCDEYPGRGFYALVDKTITNSVFLDQWVLFPWESEQQDIEDDSIVGTITNRIRRSPGNESFFANDNIAKFIQGPAEFDLLQEEVVSRMDHLLRALIIDVDNDHNTIGTARRVAKMYLHEIFRGRYTFPPEITTFPNAKNLDEIYLTGPITVRSTCSHHLLPIAGKCWIGVVPGENVVGLSKFNRIVDWISSRPQIQEENTIQIADYIEDQIKPKGLAVVIKAAHGCMTCRGIRETEEAAMTTSVMRGIFRNNAEARSEFLSLMK